MVLDVAGAQSQTDEESGKAIRPAPDNDLVGASVGVVWHYHFVTMAQYWIQHMVEDGIGLEYFAHALCLCPEDSTMGYITRGPFLLSQWNDMNEWKAQGFQGLDRDACPEAWHRIMSLGLVRNMRHSTGRLQDTRFKQWWNWKRH
jgi:hypothetical protein